MDAAFARAYAEAGIMPLEDYIAMSKQEVPATADPVGMHDEVGWQGPEDAAIASLKAENAALKDENQRLRIRLQTISDLANAPVGAQP